MSSPFVKCTVRAEPVVCGDTEYVLDHDGWTGQNRCFMRIKGGPWSLIEWKDVPRVVAVVLLDDGRD